MYTRVFDNVVKPGDRIKLMATEKAFDVEEVGVFLPAMTPVPQLETGAVGYLVAGVREIASAKIGDTITHYDKPTSQALAGYREMKPLVFCGLYPSDTSDFITLREALEKLKLNDSSFTFEPETSVALGFGFRCGFLGLLHMEVIQERLEREFDLSLIRTVPSVKYNIFTTEGSCLEVDNPAQMPPRDRIAHIEEPHITAEIIVPRDYIGNVMDICQKRRGTFIRMNQLDETRVQVFYDLPLSEILMDFYDKLKSVTRGYGSLEYDVGEYKTSDLVKLDVLLNGKAVDALSAILHRDMAYQRGKAFVEKLRELIPRQMLEVSIQAAIGSQIIARETVRALRKNVTGKCYGGDITRKRKLLEKQKEGKKRMKQIGSVEVPQEAFMAVLSADE